MVLADFHTVVAHTHVEGDTARVHVCLRPASASASAVAAVVSSAAAPAVVSAAAAVTSTAAATATAARIVRIAQEDNLVLDQHVGIRHNGGTPLRLQRLLPARQSFPLSPLPPLRQWHRRVRRVRRVRRRRHGRRASGQLSHQLEQQRCHQQHRRLDGATRADQEDRAQLRRPERARGGGLRSAAAWSRSPTIHSCASNRPGGATRTAAPTPPVPPPPRGKENGAHPWGRTTP